MRRNQVLRACVMATLGISLAPSVVRGVDRTYVGPSGGQWITSGNWSPLGAPAPNDVAILPASLAGSYTVNFGTVNYSPLTPLNALRISGPSSGTATLVQNQASSSMAAISEHIGFGGASAVYSQVAGTNTITASAFQPGLVLGEGFGTGIYNLSGGTLAVSSAIEYVGFGGDGTFNQSGGTNAATDVTLASGPSPSEARAGIYTISGGTLSFSDQLTVGEVNEGTFTQNGGLVSGGTAGLLSVGNSGSLAIGRYELNAGTLTGSATDLATGADTTGYFYQSGGTNISTTYIAAGDTGNGTYELSGGTVSTGYLFSAAGAGGDFIQRGGVATCNILNIALLPGSDGRYLQSGGTLTAGDAYVGGGTFGGYGEVSGGKGNFTVAAGAVANITGSVKVFEQGDVWLTGGALNVGTIDTSEGGRLHFTGGALTFTGDLQLGGGLSPMDLNAGQSLTVIGTTTLTTGTTLRLDGGTFSTASLSPSGGTLAFTAGTFRLTGSGLTIGNTGILGSFVQLDNGQHIDLGGSNSAAISSGAQLQLNGGSLTSASGTLTNSGLIAGTGIVGARLNNLAGGEIRALGSDVLRFQGASNGNAGVITLGGDGIVEFTAALTNTGTIAGRGSIFTGGAGLANNGTIALSGGFADVHGAVTNGVTGKAIVTGGSTSTFYNAVTNNTGSEFRVSAGSTAVFLGPVTGVSQFTGSGVKIFEGSASGGALATPGSTIVESSGTVTATSIRERTLTVNGVASIAVDGTDARTSRVTNLIIDGSTDAWLGKLDLNDNDLVVDYDPASPSPLATIGNQIKTGFAGGAWTGDGITSTQAAGRSTSAHKTALGYAEAAALGVGSFSGQSVDGSAVLIRYTYSGDANVDGKVDTLDFNALAANFGGSGKIWSQADFNYDGQVDTLDFNNLAANFGQSLPDQAAPTGTIAAGLVPEPGMLASLLGGAMLACTSRRHRYPSSRRA